MAETTRSSPKKASGSVRVILVIQRGGQLLCRQATKFKVPEVGEALTLVDEGEEAEVAGRVALVLPGPKDLPYIYGGAWGQEVDDDRLAELGFKPCGKSDLAVLEDAVG